MISIAVNYYKENKNSFDEQFRIRLHRSLSWLNKALSFYKESKDNLDFTFISLWISFNAIYGRDLCGSLKEGDKERFKAFIRDVCYLDTEKSLNNIVWNKFSRCINMILKNHYTYQKYWDYINGDKYAENWEESFKTINNIAIGCLEKQDTETLLALVFDRLYTIRNQLVHGGATCGSVKNRIQIDDGAEFLMDIIPQMLIIMMKNPDKSENWGKPFYPPIKE